LAPTVGIAATGFCYLGGILQIFIDKISKISRLPRAAVRLIQQDLSSTSAIVCIVKIFTASSSRIVNFVQIDGSLDKLSTPRNLIRYKLRLCKKVFVEKQCMQQVSTSSPSRVAVGFGSTSTPPRAHSRGTIIEFFGSSPITFLQVAWRQIDFVQWMSAQPCNMMHRGDKTHVGMKRKI
jgi:hypothetical protein